MKRTLLYILLTFIFAGTYSFGQLEGANWYFGNYAGLDFTSGNPVPVFDGQLSTSEGCSSISDNAGNLLFYTDGQLVYDKNHNLMPNGTGLLGHPSSAMSAVVCPKPGTWNPGEGRYDGYIVCTIDYESGSNGIGWSEVDMTLNNGDGDVVASTKNTYLFGTTTVESANFAVHENGCDYWLIGKEVGNNTWKVYPVTSAGVGATPVVSNVGAVIPNYYGAIKPSPNSEVVSIVNGRSGLHVYDFDRITGQLVHRYSEQSMGTSYYSLEYSPNGRFLYFNRLNDSRVFQVDLNTGTPADFQASLKVVGATANTSHKYRVGSLQLAPNGKIYMALISSGYLGVIDQPNILGTGANYIDYAVDISGINTNGNAARVVLGLPSFPNFFLKDEKHIAFTQLCNSYDAQFSLSDYDDLYGQEWYVVNSGGTFPAAPTSTQEDFIETLAPGSYDVKVMLDYNCYLDSALRTITIVPYDTVNLEGDVCFSNNLILDASNSFDFYEWQDGSTESTFSVTQAGTYSCEVGSKGEELIYNGDFELGNDGFNSNYDHTTGGMTQGQYFIGTSVPNGWWAGCGDHTSGTGNMMIIDADCGTSGTGTVGANFWCQTVSVTPNTDYYFSAFIANGIPSGNSPTVALNIDGTQITTLSPAEGACNYEELAFLWNSGTQTSVTLCLNEISNICSGADFVVDDISFSPVCYSTDEIEVFPLPTAAIDGTIEVCENDVEPIITFTGADGTADYTFEYTLNGGTVQTLTSSGNSATLDVPTDIPGTYEYELLNVEESSVVTCSQAQPGNVTITVNPLPTADVQGTIELCENAPEPTVTFTGANGTAPYTFEYSLNNGATQTIVSSGNDAEIIVPTSASGTFTYTLISVTDASTTLCSQLQSEVAIVTINPLPKATIAGAIDVCRGEAEPLITFAGANGTPPYIFTYSINGGAPLTVTSSGNVATVNAPTDTDGSYEYELISIEDNSTTTCSQTQTGNVVINVNPIPEASFENVGVCLGLTSNFSNTSNVSPVNGATNTNWDWDFGDGNTSTSENPTHVYADENVFPVTLTVTSNHGCSNTITGEGTVYPLPEVSFSPTSVCLDSNTVFTDGSSISNEHTTNTFTAWNWNFGDGNTSTQQNPIYTYANSGTFTATLEVISNHDCSTTLTETVTVHPKPSASFTGVDLVGCSPICATLTSSANVDQPSSIADYSWTMSNGETKNGPQPSFSPCFTNDGSQTNFIDVQLKVTTNEGCQNTKMMSDMIEVYHNPIADFNFEPDTPSVINPIVEFENTSQFANSYEWFIYEDTLTSFSPEFEFPAEPETYTITLIASTDEGCKDTTKRQVKILDKIVFYIPNTFTPDNNQFNELFKPVFTSGFDPQEYRLLIFNRWGELIFESNNSETGWDGTYGTGSSEVLKTGAYVWKIEFKESMSSTRHVEHGMVNLLR